MTYLNHSGLLEWHPKVRARHLRMTYLEKRPIQNFMDFRIPLNRQFILDFAPKSVHEPDFWGTNFFVECPDGALFLHAELIAEQAERVVPMDRRNPAMVFVSPQKSRGVPDCVSVPSCGESKQGDFDDMTLATTRTMENASVACKSSNLIVSNLKPPPPTNNLSARASIVTVLRGDASISGFSGGASIGDGRSVKSRHTTVTLTGKRKLQSSLSAAAEAHNAQI
jgi:hypothetical protein